jgi:hypothetical protein
MLMISLAMHVAGYATYAMFLGNIDALPPLPIDYLPKPRIPGDPTCGISNNVPEVDRRLQQSFGANCKELQHPLRLWLPDRGAAFAAGEFNIEPNGRVKLAPFSAAIYHKKKLPGDFPEISTLRCDIAFLTLDRPISSFSELNGRKVIAVELQGRLISITNNRATAEKGDDLDILISNAPLFYEERRDLIWTDGVVCLTDYQTKPATTVRGKGMEMLLAKDANPSRPKPQEPAAKGHSDSNNVEKIILHSDVEMDFWTDGGSGFLGGPPNKKNPPPVSDARGDEKPAPKAHIRIHTGGMFLYDLTKEFAWFERPPVNDSKSGRPAADPLAPNQVHVERRQTVDGKAKFDQLICDRLELQFRKKANPQPDDAATPATAGGDKEIETAKAFKRGDGEVVLALDSEGMAAYGNELHYFAGDGVKGPKTILKGDPLRSVKDGHKMVCQELHIQSANRAGEGQVTKAWGPGQIDLLDEKNPQEENRPTHIRWRDTLTVVKLKDDNEVFDLMTVEGEASFIDDLQKQELHAEKIMVWMLAPNDSAKKPQAMGSNKQEIRKLIAERRVRAFAPEFIVRQSNELTMTFLPEVTRVDHAPVLPSPDAVKPGSTDVTAPRGIAGGDAPPPPAVESKGPVEEKKPAPPIELTGKKISVHVSTVGGKKQVEGLVARGNVYVFQPGDKPGEKRIDINGQLLTIKNNADKGHTMVVHGDAKTKARVELSDLILWGPIVTIDQAANRSEVEGDGAMQMPTNKNLDGTDIPKDKPTPRITVYWKKRMTFNGKNADFYGGVQAFQQGTYSKMTCEHLVTYLDRYVSFKGDPGKESGSKDSQSAKVERIICDQNVFIDDSKVDEKAKVLVQRNIVQGWQLVNHQDGRTDITGPGQCRQLAKGGGEPTLGPQQPGVNTQPKAKAKTDADKDQWMLTHVKFPARMFYSTDEQTKTKKATFWANPGSFVDVYHFPTTDINAAMDPDHPPKDGLYLRCENLVLRGEEHAERTTQIMIARQNVYFRTDIYLGYADVVKYDENTDMVTMECFNGNFVRLYKFDEQGRRIEQAIRSARVLYNRKTGEVITTGVKSIEN